jgi:TatD DNase family protein
MIIDTHAHLTDKYTPADEVADVIARAQNAGVGAIVCATAHPDDWTGALDLAARFDNVFVTIGVHPEYAGNVSDSDSVSGSVSDGFANPKIIGIGEIGLDYHYDDGPDKKQQIEMFERWLDIARRENLPVAIHSRDAEADTIRMLKDFRLSPPASGMAQGVLHSFTGSWDMARTLLDHGFYFSANGILTFKNADALREVFAKIPVDRMVVETDAPWLAPVPYRGKKCDPFMVPLVAHALAALKNLQIEELEDILEKNTRTLYPKLG